MLWLNFILSFFRHFFLQPAIKFTAGQSELQPVATAGCKGLGKTLARDETFQCILLVNIDQIDF